MGRQGEEGGVGEAGCPCLTAWLVELDGSDVWDVQSG